MKLCVFITGTNCVGKTTLAKEIMKQFGGISVVKEQITFLVGDACFAGGYDRGKYGGVDRLKDANGRISTKALQGVVKKGLATKSIIFCEGSFMNTFGLNLTNAAFEAEKQLICCLYADKLTLYKRLKVRTGGNPDYSKIYQKQRNAINAARKWASIGVPTILFDTDRYTPTQMATIIANKIKEL